MIVCMCASVMYASAVCMYFEYRKKHTIMNSCGGTVCFGVFYVYRPLDFLVLV